MAVDRAILNLPFMLITLASIPFIHAQPKDCFEGTYTVTPPGGGKDVCELCPDGTFMPHKDHTYRNCFTCTEIEDPHLEILVTPCNRTQDSVIHCIDGYYRRLPRNPREKARCEKCTDCEYPILPCRIYEDTHCCLGKNFDVIPDKNGVPVCWEKPWLCRQGQYFDRYSFSCLPCPAGTFMSLDYHSVTECWKCPTSDRNYLPKHARITQPCNGTHPAVVECEDGYFSKHDMGHWDKHIGCSQCTSCSADQELYLGRECDQHHDTVCCSQPNMTVVDDPEGPKCLFPDFTPSHHASITPSSESTKETFCAENQYLHVGENNNKPATCKPCPPGTFMDEINHFKTTCKVCTESKCQQVLRETQTTLNCIENGRPLTGVVTGLIICSVVCFMVAVGLSFVLALHIRRHREHDYSKNVVNQEEEEPLLDMEATSMSTSKYNNTGSTVDVECL